MSTTAIAAALMMAYANVAELPAWLPGAQWLSVEEQTRFRDAQGRTIGTATPEGSGTIRFRDAQGRSIGSSSTDSGGTTRYYDPSGRSLGTSTGPVRAPFPERR
jgi:hypothetical protein